MAIGVGTTDKLLGKVADGVSALTDSNKKSDKQLTRAIEYNTFIAEKAEDNRIAQAEQTFENAKETLREFNENKRINLKNQKRFENLLENGKLEGKRRAEAEAKLRKLAILKATVKSSLNSWISSLINSTSKEPLNVPGDIETEPLAA